jgi:hypothetical protein
LAQQVKMQIQPHRHDMRQTDDVQTWNIIQVEVSTPEMKGV